MELPDLGTADQQKLRDILGVGPEWGWDRGLTYDPGFAQFKLNQKGLLASGQIDPLNMQYKAFLGRNDDSNLKLNGTINPLNLQYEALLNQGGYGLKANMPLMKGLLSLEAGKQNDADNYRIQYERNF